MSLINRNSSLNVSCDEISSYSSLKVLRFSDTGLSVVQGADTLFHLAMEGFFMPVENYQFGQFTLAAEDSVLINPGNVSNSALEVTGIIIVVEYPNTDQATAVIPEADKYLVYTYGGDTEHNIGKIMILTGSTDHGWNLVGSPGGLILNNTHDNFDVNVKVLLIS